jgi:nicotinate-nucleotide pyrophosphorylase (carboxylating)
MDISTRRVLGGVEHLADPPIGHVGGVAEDDGASLLRGKRADHPPEIVTATFDPGGDVAVAGDPSAHLLRRPGGQRLPSPGAVVIDRLAVRDREQPGAQVSGVLEPWIGPERGDEGLLKAVLGVVRTDRGDEETEHVRAVLVEQLLEGGKRDIGHLVNKRLTRRPREIWPPKLAATINGPSIDNATLSDLVARALAEDLGAGDVTAEAVVDAAAEARAEIVQKQPGVLFGLEAAAEVFRQAGAGALRAQAAEGEWRDRVPATVASVSGPARSLLAAERTSLNFLCHLSGVATLTARFVEAAEGSGATILDTRKTIPGLRALEKAAVAAGGGTNHRMGLDDAILIKDNHAALVGGVGEAVRKAGEVRPGMEVEVECGSLDEVRDAVTAGADRLLLDNMDPEGLRKAVVAAGEGDRSPKLEASGGITLENVAEIAATGVDFVSIGALTHSAPALDLSMAIEI